MREELIEEGPRGGGKEWDSELPWLVFLLSQISSGNSPLQPYTQEMVSQH